MNLYENGNVANVMGDNMGGLCSIEFVAKESIETYSSLDFTNHSAKTPIVLKSSLEWFKLIFLPETASFMDEQKDTEAGSFFAQKIKCAINKDSLELLQRMNAMRFYEYVILYRDRNGVKKLIGNHIKASRFTTKLDTGNEATQKTWFDCSFDFECEHMAIHYPF